VSSLFLICLVLLAALGHGYFWVDLTNRFHALPGSRNLVDIATLACLLMFLVMPVLVVVSWSQLNLAGLFNLADSTAMGSSPSWLGIYVYLCALKGVVKLLINELDRRKTDNPRTLVAWQQEKLDLGHQLNDVEFHGQFSQWLAALPGNQVLQLQVDRKRLVIPRLPSSHEGLKIAHISDLHMTGHIGPKWYEIIAEQVNQLQAEAIVITGDIVEKEACWPWLADSLGKLRAKHGVYFILGNHDFYIDAEHTRQLLQDQGLICLSGRSIETEWDGAPVMLTGNERPWGPHATDFSIAQPKNSERLPLKLALLHTPDRFAWACEQSADLALAGHTHGGQLRFPLLGPIVCPSRYGTRYACGVFQRGDTVMHVTRGISGKTPLRWRCPPEIALLELVRA